MGELAQWLVDLIPDDDPVRRGTWLASIKPPRNAPHWHKTTSGPMQPDGTRSADCTWMRPPWELDSCDWCRVPFKNTWTWEPVPDGF